jgi:HK97 family phage prohead protease
MEKRYIYAEITEKSSEEGEFTAIASSGKVDRHGEIVSPEGWDLKNYKKNPVILWAHDHYQMAIGKATKIWVEGEGKAAKLMFKGIFQDATELGRAAVELAKDGILKTFSVGFMPIDMDENTYEKQELLEISLVNVPANVDAMMLAYKSLSDKGFKKKTIAQLGIPIEVLDELQNLRKDVTDLNVKVDTLAKTQSPVAPTTPKIIRTRQSVVKVIAKGSDRLLAGEKKGISQAERVKMYKIIKRGAEILSQSNKGDLKNG